MKGVDLRTVAKLMGHRDIEMTMRYAHLGPDHLQAAVDALDTRGGTGRRTGRPMGNCWHGLVQMPVGYEIFAGYFSDYLIVFDFPMWPGGKGGIEGNRRSALPSLRLP